MLKNYIQDYATLKKQIEYIVKKKQYIGPDDVTRMMYFSSSEFADLVAQNTRALEKGLADLQNDFKKLKYSEHKFMEHAANGSHQIVIVASSLDLSTERIVNYLNKMDIAINVIFFQVFQDGNNQYLSRAWLIDPVETESKATAGPAGERGEWNGEYYVSFGQSVDRDWEEAVKYGFICGGGGRWYSQTLFLLSPGDRVWVNIPKQGYVGVGVVTGGAVRASDFQVNIDGVDQPFLAIAQANYHRQHIDDEEKSEFFVPVEWTSTKPIDKSVSEVEFFGNQNTVARPKTHKWNHTIERLTQKFGVSQ